MTITPMRKMNEWAGKNVHKKTYRMTWRQEEKGRTTRRRRHGMLL
jgi:hypothetical protein